jgi:hypothetical protein
MREICDFFRYTTGFEPTEYQKELLTAISNMETKKIIISAGRQSGKTLCSAVAVLWYVFEYPTPLRILLVSAQENILYFHIREIFKNHGEFEPEITQQGTYSIVPLRGFETKRGAVVYVRGSTDRQVRGLPADIVLIDEAADVKDDIVLTAMGNLSGTISKFILLSTPHIPNSLFVKWASDPDTAKFELHQWSGEGLSWHNKDIEDTKKREYTKAKYAIEVLGRPPTKAERQFFSSAHIDKCFKEHVDAERTPNSIIEAGIDWGFDPCKTVLTITEKIGVRRRVIFVKAWHKKAIETIAPDIAEILTKHKVDVVKADSAPQEYQGFVERYYKPKIHYIVAAMHKDEMLAQLQRKITQHSLEIGEADIQLITQLKKYRRGMRTGDDLVDSLVLSCYEPITPLGGKPEGRVFVTINKHR